MRRIWWVICEAAHYVRTTGRWWLLPILILLVLLVVLVLILHTASLFPIIYPFV